ncbi:hypothetical protein [Pseudomonas sp. G5(2012)]|uniref:hypothetical protein n=1 Tax=Pseudomonas sp. G5(2012) TaxID=1268068 RepID=UPI0005B4EC14|nr:hypothetical protein [Pseudomonas sp. G5(2012)]
MKNFLDATVGSTHATNVAVTLYMPPAEATRVLAYLDSYQAQQPELERLQAEIKRLTPDHAHARACRTQSIEALVLAALDNATLYADVMDSSWCKRTGKVRDHLLAHPERYGSKVPSHASVRKVLIKHGYM